MWHLILDSSRRHTRRQDTALFTKKISVIIYVSFHTNWPRTKDGGQSLRSQSLVIGPSSLNKKPFIHNRDEEFSPRYHPNSFEGCKLQVLNLPTFKRSFCYNGLSRRWLLDSPTMSLLRDNRRVRSRFPFRGCWHSRYIPLLGFHLSLPTRWRDDLLLLSWLFNYIY